MSTDQDIKDDFRAHHGTAIRNAWIAHVKELNGLGHRATPDTEPPTWRVDLCPDAVRPLIEESMRRLGMLPP